METTTIQLPKAPSPPTSLTPDSCLWYGLPKCGKTTKLAELPNCLFIDAERGANKIEAMKLQPPEGAGPVTTFKWIKEVAKTIKEQGKPYDHVILETLSYLDELSEWVGTWNYMHSPQGKKFNRVGRVEGAALIDREDPNYESVHTVGEGYGYRWSREAMMDIVDAIKGCGKICTHYTVHVADKYIASKSGDQVRIMDLSLTGKLRNIIPRDLDAIGYMFQKDGELWVSFRGSEEKVGGMRGSPHMKGFEGKLNWNELFLIKQ